MDAQKKKPMPCAYCGTSAILTKDHIVPKGLFRKSSYQNVPYLWVCQPCNNRKSRYDRYLQHFLICNYETFYHPVVQELYPGFVESIRTSDLAKHVVGKTEPVWMQHPSGLLVQARGVILPEDWMSPTLAAITRGLYRYYLKRSLPKTTQITVRRIVDRDTVFPLAKLWVLSGAATYRSVEDGEVFNCMYRVDPKRPDRSRWFLSFYSKAVFTVLTEPLNCPTIDDEIQHGVV